MNYRCEDLHLIVIIFNQFFSTYVAAYLIKILYFEVNNLQYLCNFDLHLKDLLNHQISTDN